MGILDFFCKPAVHPRVSHKGWLPDVPDHRDFVFTAHRALLNKVPSSVDLRHGCPPVYDQGQLGSCTGNAIAGAFEFDLVKQKLDVFRPSRLFIYYNERVLEGTVSQDAGAQIRDGIKSIAQTGVCKETTWPYKISKFATKPCKKCFTEAKSNTAVKYARVAQTEADLKATLASGFPVVFGFSVYESFESDAVASTGVVPMPGADEQQVGGHAVVLVGYDDKSRRFIVRNSWGTEWGMAGYFTMPYEYVTDNNLADDFWVVQVVS